MAPALTDATSQGKYNLSEACVLELKGSKPNPERQTKLRHVCSPGYLGSTAIDVSEPETLNHVSDLGGVKSTAAKRKLLNDCQLQIIDKNLCKLNLQKASAFQQEFLKSINILDRMNQPVPLNGNQQPVKEDDYSPELLINDDKPILLNGKKKLVPVSVDPRNDVQQKEIGFQTVGIKNKILLTDSVSVREDSFDNRKSTETHQIVNDAVAKDKVDYEIKVLGTCTEFEKCDNVPVRTSLAMPQVSNVEKLRSIVESSSAMDIRLDASKSQAQLEKRLEFYLRRLRRLQGKDVEDHVRNQISLCLEHQQKNLHSLTKSISSQDILSLKTNNEFNINVLNKNLSTAALVNLVQQAQKQASHHDPLQRSAKLQQTTYLLNMDKRTRKECQKVSDQFLMNSHHAELVVDSDATESSSGGESGDEMDVPNRKIHKPINKQAEWKWSAERAGMASRWTWLQAQVSDLEYRIRQQSDIHKQIRQSKGSIVLGDPPSPPNLMTKLLPGGQTVSREPSDKQFSPCNISTLLSNVDRQANKITQSLGNILTPRPSPHSNKSCTSSPASSVNGLTESPYGSSSSYLNVNENSAAHLEEVAAKNSDTQFAFSDNSCQAARCRPLRSYRKRKLLSTQNLHQTIRKANRLSTVDCQCCHPVTPCPMCGGRYNNKQPLDADHMPCHERISLLDSAYHPVLSFQSDVPLYLKFVSLIKTGDWMNKQRKNNVNKIYKKRKYKTDTYNNDNRKKLRKNVAAALIQSAKIKNKYENKTMKRGHNSVLRRKIKKGLNSDYKRRRAAKLAMAAMKRHTPNESLDLMGGSASGLNHSASSSMLKELRADSLRKKRGESAYDINNIVIPYSIAAATRVEKLQYKEIATPEWRDISLEPVQELEDQSDAEFEDLTDESFLVRHQKCEAEERKRFASFIQYPMRRRFRIDTTSLDSASIEPKISDMFSISSDQISPVSSVADELFSASNKWNISRKERLSTGSSFDDTREFDPVTVDPWISRSFPLSELEYEEMKAVEPHIYETQPVRTPICVLSNNNTTDETLSRTDSTPSSSRPSSPFRSSASNSINGDDPDDPEWTSENTQIKDEC